MAADSSVLSFLAKNPRQADRPADGKGCTYMEPETFHSLPHFILTNLWVAILISPCTSGETLSKLFSYSCLSILTCEHQVNIHIQ